jgi:outer membrane protein OmpA-like peptidoglycan-associated protein
MFRKISLLLMLFSTMARAESGSSNIHLDVGGMFPPYGGTLNVGYDFQFKPGYAVDFSVGGGYLAGGADIGFFQTTAGIRFRFLDNKEGYLNQKGGDAGGNLFVVPRIGVILDQYAGAFTFDVQVGYEWSVAKPMQLGVFVRPGFAVGPITSAIAVPYVVVGLGFSFEAGKSPPKDTDHDGLPDEREQVKYHSSAYNPDTDNDGLKDGAEVYTHKTSPTDPDTDHGGSRDGWEVEHGRNPLDPSDDDQDRDRVPDERDACPGTPPNTEVDDRGCAILRQKIVLEGITFAFNSANIQPESEPTLLRAAQILRDNPGVRVEIEGHTDDVGKPDFNQRLSESRARSVGDWLIAHGIPAERISTRGYGATKPRAPNDSEENKARNRRIEFRRLGD